MADEKITQLTEAVIAAGDYIVFVDDPAGTPATRRDTVQGIIDLVPASGGADRDGDMYNGSISVSVSSNNLTVAIKTKAGADPSAGDPVTVWLGGTERTISGALSVTKNAATNWFDAGSSELATFLVNYFVYLGYNATDGVVIGFARIPYGKTYSDFSTTSTNEAYCAISTITNASATDSYSVIGRFSATLSAGAGYTWSISGTGAVINRPIFQTDWLSWEPVRTGYSANPTSTVYRYMIDNTTLYFTGRDGAAGTSNATGNTFTLPYTALAETNGVYQIVCACDDNSAALTTPSYGAMYVTGGWKTVTIGKDFSFNFTGWTNSGTKRVRTATGFYRII